jgi:hypothetical protein
MRPVLRLFDPQARSLFGTVKVQANVPPTFESLGLPNWLVLYEANLPIIEDPDEDQEFTATPKDRALIYLDGKFSKTLNRSNGVKSVLLKLSNVKEIKLLVETQGRVNFGNVDVEDFKVHFFPIRIRII